MSKVKLTSLSKHIAGLVGGYLDAGPTNPRTYSRKEVLAITGITSRQLTYYVQMGVVSRPEGRTRASRYSDIHLAEVRRVVDLLTRPDMTVAEIADAYSRRRRRSSGARSVAALERRGGPVVQHVYEISEGISIVCADDLTKTEEVILARLRQSAAVSEKERRDLKLESLGRL